MSRTILITGGGTGIGRAVAHHFADAGDDVLVTGRRPGPLEETAAGRRTVRPLVCDHTDPRALTALLTELPERIDVLVNNAGGNTDLDADGADDLAAYARNFRANLDANLLSAALTTKALDGRLAPGGAVVHIGSIAADQGAGAYGAAKAGLASWNVELSRTLGPRDITANVVSPGYVADTDFFRDQLTDERRDRLVAASAVGRPGSPDDIAGTVAFLASPAARHLTGQVLNVNGGTRTTR
ncbi:SDR family NAD(P)-dependent oxidoreductase [Streptomyces decoyicus]|uniref:SDR family NAD(P)-dependent oxidoreductase n=1 Tax=Streptomyces decoyicus TaxID=249567 RepID=UPI00069D93EF|nr:SDR family oxidoreductase [Streptomyces decoyicus]KOG38229.1 3-oxoacyl-ACP reductase [Streptomyces decoyicus]QZY15468.1 SDR family oxidoreductase [Streptomyces decoyicus]